MIRPAAFALLLAAIAPPVFAEGNLSDADRRLLQSAISTDAANAMGKSGDAAGLERIVALGDPALVSAFGYGMALARMDALPPDVEAVVVRRFDDPRTGAALRAFTQRYRSRALFDLHLARIRAAYRADEPSLQQVFNTDLPGIEDDLLSVADKFAPTAGETTSRLAYWLSSRKHPAAIPMLLAAIAPSLADPRSQGYNQPVEALIAYAEPSTWKRAEAEVEGVRAAGNAKDSNYAAARRALDGVLKDPQATLERRRLADVRTAFLRRIATLTPGPAELENLRTTDPRGYVDAKRRRVEAEEAIARELGAEALAPMVMGGWTDLGLHLRFQLGDAKAAIAALEKAAAGNDLLGQVALADTYQLALRDKGNALRAYRLALQTASWTRTDYTPYAPAGSAMNSFWRQWLAAEIRFLETGTSFAGSVPESAIAGFFEGTSVWERVVVRYFPGWPARPFVPMLAQAPGPQGNFGNMRAGTGAPTWKPVAATLSTLETEGTLQRLRDLPTSRLGLLVSLRALSALKDPATILAQLARHDPSGYWTAVVMGTVAFHESGDDARRDLALSNGVADALPGMAREPRPNALARASSRFLGERGLRAQPRAP